MEKEEQEQLDKEMIFFENQIVLQEELIELYENNNMN